jgi:hypothetical protein
MKSVNLMDGSFAHAYASGYGGENMSLNLKPKYFKWDRSCSSPGPIFYTDAYINETIDIGDDRPRVAWLLEPPSIRPNIYKRVVEIDNKFDYILTFNRDLLRMGDKYLYYPIGGSWIARHKWGIYPKRKRVSIIVSEKRGARGHKMRHEVAEIAERLGVDLMGRGYRTIQSKTEALSDYRYSIVIENCKLNNYFTEKLIDCLSQGTIPIYWGSPTVSDFFDMDGIITWTTVAELKAILSRESSDQDYQDRLHAVRNNFDAFRGFVCAEDWIFEHYRWLFDG